MSSLPLLDGLGALLRDQGVARVAEAVDPEWRDRAEQAVELLASRRQPFGADEVRALAGDPDRSNAMGAVFLRAANRGLIERCGFSRSRRGLCHAHLNPSWKGRQR